MAKISKQQYDAMIAKGMTPESISTIAKKRGFELPDNKGLLQKTTERVNAIFPGGKVGESIGTLAGYGLTKASEVTGLPIAPGGKYGFHKANEGESQIYDTSAPSVSQVAGDIAQGGLMVASPNIGVGGTAGSRILSNTVLGAGIGYSGSMAKGESYSENLKSGLTGGLVSGALSGGTEAIAATIKALPKWLAKAALPKLESKNIPYALDKVKVGSISNMSKESSKSISSYEDSIQAILSHPENKQTIGGTPTILNNALKDFGDSNYTVDTLVKNAKKLAPNVGKLLTKFENGQANIQEINAIRKELDRAVQTVYTNVSRPPESKLLGAALSNSMRNYVKTLAPETESIFANYSKEIGLKKALMAAIKKGEQKVRMGDIAAGAVGFYQGGWDGAVKAILAERLLLNPSAQLSAAKILQSGQQSISPVVGGLIQGTKANIIKGITDK
jgi:hypothetical protein